jgi:hypothetical protein
MAPAGIAWRRLWTLPGPGARFGPYHIDPRPGRTGAEAVRDGAGDQKSCSIALRTAI